MALWRDLPGKLETSILKLAGGIHTGLPPIDISEEQSLEVLNLDTYNYPALSLRPGRATKGSTVNAMPTGMFKIDNDLYLGYGTSLVKWGGSDWDLAHPVKTGLSGNRIEGFKFLNMGIFTDGLNWYKIVGGAVSLLGGSPPAGKFGVGHVNRVYLAGLTAEPNAIRHSALRKPEDYTTVDDAGTIYVETPDSEVITALTAAFDHVIVFKEHHMWELYGTGPINYQPVEGPPGIGCVAHRSIVLLNSVLYWLGDRAVYAYRGGAAPEDISFPIRAYMEALNRNAWSVACAGTDGTRYILAIPTGSSTVPDTILSYDPRVGAWHVWSLGNPVVFLQDGGALLVTDSTGQVAQCSPTVTTDFGTPISWTRVSKVFLIEPQVRWQSLKRVTVVADLESGATMTVAVSGSPEGDDWQVVKTLIPTSVMARTKILVPPAAVANKDFIRIRLSGSGPVTLHRLERVVRVKEV